MRSSWLSLVVILTGCGSASPGVFEDDPSQGGTGGESGSATGGRSGSSGRGGGASGGVPELGPAVEVVPGSVGLVGVTSDGWVVFRDAEVLRAAPLDSREAIADITDRPGSVLIRGPVVFNWADVDWSANVGELFVWTAEGGTHELGTTLYAEGLVAVDEAGSAIVYPANADEEAFDLMIAGNDFGSPQPVLTRVGLGSEETCGASFAFVGERLFVGSCEVGSRDGSIVRVENVDGEWQSTPIADDALPIWSADASGERVFYLSSTYNAYCSYDGDDYLVDASVSRGTMLPDGSALLYTVGDQLRRTELPGVNPIPVVTRGYSQPVGFSPSFEHALYSTTVTYVEGTQRDLLLVPTDAFDAAPIELVNEPLATLGRSNMTADGRFVLYLTDVSSDGGDLHVVDVDGAERLVLPNVVEVVAAFDSTIVFTDNPSDPEQYPVVADLKVIDVSLETEPRLVEARILEGRNFQLDSSASRVVYVRSGVDRDVEDPERTGVFYRDLR